MCVQDDTVYGFFVLARVEHKTASREQEIRVIQEVAQRALRSLVAKLGASGETGSFYVEDVTVSAPVAVSHRFVL